MIPPGLRRRRRLTVLLLMVAGCINYIDRAALSVGNTAIMTDLHLSYSAMGWLLSSFAWAYLVCQIPAGMLADRLSIRRFLGTGLVIWSAAQIAFGLVSGLPGLIACRALLGFGEAPLFLAGTRALVRWFGPEERGGPIGLFNGSAALGPALAPPLLLAILVVAGWRGMSVAIGLASLLLAGAWFLYYRDPAVSGPDMPQARVLGADLGFLLRQRATWVVSIGFAGVVYVTWLYGTWMPAWLQRTQHLSAGTADLLSAIPQISSFFGSILGGGLCDRLGARGLAPFHACRTPLVASLLAASVATGLTAMDPGLILSLLLMAFALFAGGIAMTCGWTLATVLTSEHRIATLEAIQNTGGSFGGAMAPAVTGLLAQYFGSFAPAMLVAGGVGTGCAAIYLFGLRAPDGAPAPARIEPFDTVPQGYDR